jgi:hypothetical protein
MATPDTLIGILNKLGDLDEASIVYASEPWTMTSQSVVASEPEEGGLPSAALGIGASYFLEVAIVKELLEDWPSDWPSTAQAKCQRVIDYALNDA